MFFTPFHVKISCCCELEHRMAHRPRVTKCEGPLSLFFFFQKCSSCHEACHFQCVVLVFVSGFGMLPGHIGRGGGTFANAVNTSGDSTEYPDTSDRIRPVNTSLHIGLPSCPQTQLQCTCHQRRCHNSKLRMFLWKQRWTGRRGCARRSVSCPCRSKQTTFRSWQISGKAHNCHGGEADTCPA